jgi:hypothetical protein
MATIKYRNTVQKCSTDKINESVCVLSIKFIKEIKCNFFFFIYIHMFMRLGNTIRKLDSFMLKINVMLTARKEKSINGGTSKCNLIYERINWCTHVKPKLLGLKT